MKLQEVPVALLGWVGLQGPCQLVNIQACITPYPSPCCPCLPPLCCRGTTPNLLGYQQNDTHIQPLHSCCACMSQVWLRSKLQTCARAQERIIMQGESEGAS